MHEYEVPTARQREVPLQLRKLEDYVYIYTVVALARCKDLSYRNIQYVQRYSRGGGGAGEQVAGAKSSLALGKMLHADAYIVRARRTLATLATNSTRTIPWASVSYKF